MEYRYRFPKLLFAALAALACRAHAAQPAIDRDAFLEEPRVAEGLGLLQRLGTASLETLQARCWHAVKPESADLDANQVACFDEAASAVDPQASFIPHGGFGSPTSSEGGVGISIKKMDDGSGFVVTDVFPGTPAARAEIHAGDRVTEVDGQGAASWTLPDMVARLRGKPETPVVLTLQRDTRPALKLTLQRARIRLAPLYDVPLKAGWYVQVRDFPEGLMDRFASAVQTASQAGLLQQVVVIDLRGNRGGLTQQIIQFAAMLAPELQPVMYEAAMGRYKAIQPHRSDDDWEVDAQALQRLRALPFVVLVDRNTGSGAEWLAEVLKQRPGTWVLGERTAGIAKIAEAHEVPDLGYFKMPVGSLFPGRGMPVDGYGVTPDEAHPTGPLRAGLPPDWLLAWLDSGAYRGHPAREAETPAAPQAQGTAATCVGDMQLPPSWHSGPLSAERSSMTAEFRSETAQFVLAESTAPAQEKLDATLDEYRKQMDSTRQSMANSITRLQKQLRQGHMRDAERKATTQRISALQRRLRDVGLHALDDTPGATLVVSEEDDLVLWVHHRRLYRVIEQARPTAALADRKATYASLLGRIAQPAPAEGAPALCMLGGPLPLMKDETLTDWAFSASWKTDDTAMALSVEAHNGNNASGPVDRATNLDEASSSDRELLEDGPSYRCTSRRSGVSHQVLQPARLGGEPAVLRATSTDAVQQPGDDVPAASCRVVRVINRVPLDDKAHWHRIVRLSLKSNDTAAADAQLQQWQRDFEAVPPRETPAKTAKADR